MINFSKYFSGVIIFLILLSFSFPDEAYAYLDLGTGSYIFQMIIAVFIGGLFALKLFWGKVKTFFNNLFSKVKKD
jgi:hypothetical protein